VRTRDGIGRVGLAGLLALTLAAHSGRAAHAGAGGDVVLKSRETPLKVGKEVVARPDVFRVYRVARADGDWLWLTSDGPRGWVRAANVVPLEQAVAYFSAAIKERPDDPWAYQMRALVFAHFGDFEHAIADDSEAIKRDTGDPVSFHNRGNARLARKDYDGAIADYNRAIRLDPKDVSSYANRGLAWAAKGEYDLAIADDNQAIRLGPKDGAKYRQRALAWAALQEYDRALADYAQALKVDPDDVSALNGQAWVWATAPDDRVRDGRKAVESARRAEALSGGKNPYVLGTLAAACAEAGDFEEAVRWQTKAIERFVAEHLDAGPHRPRLALYKAGKAFRDARQN
jgi:tetratricopeptide (TPR) repeat protein